MTTVSKRQLRWSSVAILVVLTSSCSTTNAGPIAEQWAKPGNTAACLSEKGTSGVRYSVQAFYPPDTGVLRVEKVELSQGASNVRIIGAKAVQQGDVGLGSGYGWPQDVDATVNKEFKPETWRELANFQAGPRSKGRIQVFVGLERIDKKVPGIVPGVQMTYTIDGTTYTAPSVEYMLIDSPAACAAENWRKRLPPAHN